MLCAFDSKLGCFDRVICLKENNLEGTQFEKQVRNITVRVTSREGETLDQLYTRLDAICSKIEDTESTKERNAWTQDLQPEVAEAVSQVQHFFGLTDKKRSDAGLTGDYHMVILSLWRNFDQCMGTSAIAKEWNINTGRVSRVFTASRKKFEAYKGHFEKCKTGGYRFTKDGLSYALDTGLSEILGEKKKNENK